MNEETNGTAAQPQQVTDTATETVSTGSQVAAPTAGEPDFDNMSLEDLRQYIAQAESGETALPGEEAEKQAEQASPAGEEVKTEEQGKTETIEIPPDLPFEEFEKKAKEYLESVEIPPQMQTIIKRYEEEAKKRAETVDFLGEEDVEVAKKVIDSFKRIVSFRQDETGEFVPDTEGLKMLFLSDFQKELPYVLRDLNTLPSTKYQGHTVFQEFIRDYANLDDAGMMNLQYVIESGGKLPIPDFVPEGLTPQYSEAYWQSPDREQIAEVVREAMDVIKDETAPEYDKQMANARLAQINQRLYQVQIGINAMKQQAAAAKQIEQRNKEAVEQTATKNYIDTTKSLLESFTKEISGYLTDIFDESGAPLAAFGITRLAEAAVAGDEYSNIARQKLAEMGIKYDWNKAAGSIERLWQAEQKIAKLTLENANSLAVKVARDEKATVLREIKRYEKELAGQITKRLIEGYSKRLKKKTASVAKPAVVKNKVSSGLQGTTTPAEPNYDAMSLEELRARIGELRHSLKQQEGIATM